METIKRSTTQLRIVTFVNFISTITNLTNFGKIQLAERRSNDR